VSLFAFLLPARSLPTGPDVSDKVEHAAIFLVLAVTGRYASYAVGRLFVGLVGYALLSEVLQAVLPIGRNGDWHDIVADTLGIVAGLVVVLVITRSLDRVASRDRS
jgi:VanZ family protein